jgi:hypothetical protein
VGGQHCCSFRTRHLFGVDGSLEACSTGPYNADIRSELHDILECKQVLQRSGSGTSASSISENFVLQNSAKVTYIRKPNRLDSVDDKGLAGSSLSSTRSHTMRLWIDQNLSWQRHPLSCMTVGQETPGGTQSKRLTAKCYLLLNSNKV